MVPLRMLSFLLIMISVNDTTSTCNSEFSPLILEPTKIVAEYGDKLSVKCSSTLDEDKDMFWTVGDDSVETDDGYSVSYNLSLSDWNMTAQCKIVVNASFECTKDLEITVYKTPEVFSFVKNVKAADDVTVYELQFDFIDVVPVEKLVAKCFKNDEIIKSYQFNSTSKTPANVSSILSVNISRGEHVAQIHCLAVLDIEQFRDLSSVYSQTHNISAHYAPEFNTSSDIEDIYGSESDNVTLNCVAEGNPPPVFAWTCDGLNVSHSLNQLTLAPVNVSTNCICTAANYLGNITKEIHVHVIKQTVRMAPTVQSTTGAPILRDCPLTLTPPELVVRFGDPALVTCHTSAPDVIGIGWEATVGGLGLVNSTNLTWVVEKLDNWNTEASCFVNLNDGQQCSVALAIILYQTPETASVVGPNGPMIEGKNYTLECHIKNLSENLSVIWYRDNETVQTDSLGDAQTPVSVLFPLKIKAERNHNGSLYRCEARLNLGPNGPVFLHPAVSAPFTAIVYYEPVIQDCPSQLNVLEDEFIMHVLHCETDGNPPPVVQWSYKDELINSSRPLSRNDSGEYIAMVENYLGKTNTSVHVTVEYIPLFSCDKHYEVEMSPVIQTKCKPEGIPPPLLTWFKDGKEVVPRTKHDSGEYVLRATNKHGTAEHTLYLNILYAPNFMEGNVVKEVIQGENVTLDCNAEGNPPPVIQWKFLSETEPTEWRQKTIAIPGATSTTAGVYSCHATNKVGTVTRSVTLVIKGKTTGIPHSVIWGFLILLLILILLLLVAFFRNRQKKQGQYAFISGKAGSDIPLSSTVTEGNP